MTDSLLCPRGKKVLKFSLNSALIRTPHYYGQFALSLEKESPYIFSKLNPLNTDTFYGLLSVRIKGFDSDLSRLKRVEKLHPVSNHISYFWSFPIMVSTQDVNQSEELSKWATLTHRLSATDSKNTRSFWNSVPVWLKYTKWRNIHKIRIP